MTTPKLIKVCEECGHNLPREEFQQLVVDEYLWPAIRTAFNRANERGGNTTTVAFLDLFYQLAYALVEDLRTTGYDVSIVDGIEAPALRIKWEQP